jgi:hypothetical protein
MVDVLEPWHLVNDELARALESELRRELSPDHLLGGRAFLAVARRQDCDDVLFQVEGVGFAVVHLTWSGRVDPRWPRTEIYGSLDDWIERRMKPDHEEVL